MQVSPVSRSGRLVRTNSLGFNLDSSADQNNGMDSSYYICRAIVRPEVLMDVFVLRVARIGLAPEQGRLNEP